MLVLGLGGGLRWPLPARVFTHVACAEEEPGHEYHPEATVALHQLPEEHRGNLVNRNQQGKLSLFTPLGGFGATLLFSSAVF